MTKLNASDNNLIKNVFFIKKLKILYAKQVCGIDQNYINSLNLIELYTHDNEKKN